MHVIKKLSHKKHRISPIINKVPLKAEEMLVHRSIRLWLDDLDLLLCNLSMHPEILQYMQQYPKSAIACSKEIRIMLPGTSLQIEGVIIITSSICNDY